MTWLLLLGACGVNPYAPYWKDASLAPRVDDVQPAAVTGFDGGAEVRLLGRRLGTTRTVSIGGRNAEIVEAAADHVVIVVPAAPPGGGTHDVALVTDDGLVRLDRAFTWTVDAGEFLRDEIASVAVQRVDCPSEAYGTFEGDGVAIPWCGPAMGSARAEGWLGAQPQPGYAGELAGYARLSQLPTRGQARLRTGAALEPIRPPTTYGEAAAGDTVEITTERRFQRDLAFVEARLALAERYLGDLSASAPQAWLFDREACLLSGFDVTRAEGATLTVDGAPGAGTYGVWLGVEIAGADVATVAARVTVDGGDLVSERTGFVLAYDDYTGALSDAGVAGLVGPSAWLPGVEYTVTTDVLGERLERGRLAPVTAVTGVVPDLLSGAVELDRADPLAVQWAPLVAIAGEPSFLVVELRVWDADVDDVGAGTDVARVTAHAVDADGAFTVAASVLAGLPEAPNAVDANGDPVGLWGELAVVRHQLRKAPVDDGDLVVDFVSAVRGPVRVR